MSTDKNNLLDSIKKSTIQNINEIIENIPTDNSDLIKSYKVYLIKIKEYIFNTDFELFEAIKTLENLKQELDNVSLTKKQIESQPDKVTILKDPDDDAYTNKTTFNKNTSSKMKFNFQSIKSLIENAINRLWQYFSQLNNPKKIAFHGEVSGNALFFGSKVGLTLTY